MNKFAKGYVSGIVTVALVLSVGMSGFAASSLKNITAQIDSAVKVILNGKTFVLKDEKGGAVKPILYNGTYYIPANSVATATGLVYNLDTKTNTIQMGERSTFVYVDATMYKDFYGTMFTKDPAKVVFEDKAFKSAIVNSMPLTYSDSFLGDIKLNKKFTTFTATVCLSEKAAKEQIFNFEDKATKEVLKSITLQPGEMMEVTFDVVGVTELRLNGAANQGGADAIIVGDPRMK